MSRDAAIGRVTGGIGRAASIKKALRFFRRNIPPVGTCSECPASRDNDGFHSSPWPLSYYVPVNHSVSVGDVLLAIRDEPPDRVIVWWPGVAAMGAGCRRGRDRAEGGCSARSF